MNLPTPLSQFSAWSPGHFLSGGEQAFVPLPPIVDDDGLAEYNLITLRDLVIFPRMTSPLMVGRDASVQALNDAVTHRRAVMVAAQIDSSINVPTPAEIYSIGVEVGLGQLLRMPDNTLSILVRGVRRLEIVSYSQTEPFLRVKARPFGDADSASNTKQAEAMLRAALSLFERVVNLNETLPEEAYIFALNIDQPGPLADLIAAALSLPLALRQSLLETADPLERLQRIIALMGRELDVLELEDHIHTQVQNEFDRNQREAYLREQLRTIQSELGEGDMFTQELLALRGQVIEANLPEEVQIAALREVERLMQMPPMSPETGIIRSYLEWVVALPWHTATDDDLDLSHAQKVLDAHHYGLPRVKERILEYLAVRQLAADRMRQPILCFLGPPGTGKTSVGKAIAEALGRKFVRLSLGGVRDEAEIRGHRRTYIGALPGRILQTMRRAGTVNPVFMLDEIDKLGSDYRGDPSSALLEVLDPEQNFAFSDHYIGVPYDLSKVLFITTANYSGPIPWALEDRMETINFPGYIEPEKIEIARQFLIPRELRENGLKANSVRFSDDTLTAIIRQYTYEAGVRDLDRQLAKICRKVAYKRAQKVRVRRDVTPDDLQPYLGPPHNTDLAAEKEDTVGVAMGLAWTPNGGDIIPVEVILIPESKGRITLTGQIGEVMRESFEAGFSWLRARARKLEIDPAVFDTTDIHIHLAEGAIRKDGPSAGVTLATALISAFTVRKVRHDVAMTGEITLRGSLLPIGGVREKLLAARRAGIMTVILPRKNEKDLADVPEKITEPMTIHFADTLDEVLGFSLLPPPDWVARKPRRYRRYWRIKPHNRRSLPPYTGVS